MTPPAFTYPQPPSATTLISRIRHLFARIMAAASPQVAERRRQEASFISLVELHAETINRICRSFASNEADFNDLRQDALVNIWKGVSSFRSEAASGTWIYRVVLNTCVSTYRASRRFKNNIPLESAEALSDNSDALYDDLQWLRDAIASLPPDDHAIILMWLDEMTYEDIAEVMGLNRNTVATRVRRIKLKIQNLATQPGCKAF